MVKNNVMPQPIQFKPFKSLIGVKFHLGQDGETTQDRKIYTTKQN